MSAGVIDLIYFLLNFFFLDRDPKKCARYHGDKHLNKMVVEYAQIVSAVWWINGLVNEEIKGKIYKLSHKGHPVVKWACQSAEHYSAIVNLGLALIKEKKRRIANMVNLDKKLRRKWKPEHQSMPILLFCKENLPSFPGSGWVDPPKCMPECYWNDEYGNALDVIESYRLLYAGSKSLILKWEPYVEAPDFLTEKQECIKRRKDILDIMNETSAKKIKK